LSIRWLFALVGLLAALAGTALWLAARAPSPPANAAQLSPGALMAATFRDLDGRPHALGEFQGKIVVLNFWATWCAPCREEMPGFERLQAEWGTRGVQFVGISNEEPAKVVQFARAHGVTYPLWTGGDEVQEMSRRLGNERSVLPHTLVLDAAGRVVDSRVGAYGDGELAKILSGFAAKTR
jgi:thiol-disulfide isomerase/thioredoxin